MMNGLKSIRRERATLERNRVVIGSMLESSEVDDYMIDSIENFYESVSDEELEALIDKIPESDEESDQVERILKSDEDMDVDAILDVSADSEI